MALNQYGWFLDGHAAGNAFAISEGITLTAGKYYWEVTIDSGGQDGTSGYGIIAGVAMPTTELFGIVAPAINAAQPNSAGGAFISIRVDGAGLENANGWGYPTRAGGIGAGAANANGNVFGFALDAVNNKLWYRNLTRNLPTPVGGNAWAGGASEGDPATNVLGADLATLAVTGSICVVVGCSHGSGSAKGVGTINFGATAFTGTAPTGFNSIESVFPGADLNPNDNSNIVLSNGNLTFAGTNVPVSFTPAISGFTTNVGYTSAVRSRFLIAQV